MTIAGQEIVDNNEHMGGKQCLFLTQQIPYTSILPFNEDSETKGATNKIKLLRLIRFFYSETISALEHFSKREYKKFDAQVGENLCQIRACALLDIVNHSFECKTFDIDFLKIFFSKKIEVLDNIILLYSTYKDNSEALDVKKINSNELVFKFINRHGLGFTVRKFTLFILLSYILYKFCKFNDKGIPCRMDFDKLIDLYNLSKYQAKKIIRHSQKWIAKFSCDYLKYIAFSLERKDLLFLVNFLRKKSNEDREVIACCFGMKLIFMHILKANYPIVFSIKKCFSSFKAKKFFLYMPTSESDKKYNLTKRLNISGPAFVVEAVSYESYNSKEEFDSDRYFSHLLSIGIEKIIMLNAASHPQYTGTVLKEFAIDPYLGVNERNIYIDKSANELSELQKQAKFLGFEKGNSKGCLIEHIFCDNIENYNFNNQEFLQLNSDERISEEVYEC